MFDDEFEVVVADTDYSRSINYRLRYNVYCLEARFEDPDQFHDKQEYDKFDENAEAHFLVRSRRSGEWVAAMRMIKADYGGLPTTNHAIIEKSLRAEVAHNMVEISRLCVVSGYRNKKISSAVSALGENISSWQSPSQVDEKNREPEIMLGLLRAGYRYSLNNDIGLWLFMITPGLARILIKIGLNIDKVGPISDFRGKRAPHVCSMHTFISGLPEKSSRIASMFDRCDAYSVFSKLDEKTVPKPQYEYA